jgi:hypothetical protein
MFWFPPPGKQFAMKMRGVLMKKTTGNGFAPLPSTTIGVRSTQIEEFSRLS